MLSKSISNYSFIPFEKSHVLSQATEIFNKFPKAQICSQGALLMI